VEETRGAGGLCPARSAAQLSVHFFKSCSNTVWGSARATWTEKEEEFWTEKNIHGKEARVLRSSRSQQLLLTAHGLLPSPFHRERPAWELGEQSQGLWPLLWACLGHAEAARLPLRSVGIRAREQL